MAYNPTVADTSQLKIGSPLVKVEGIVGIDGPSRDRAEVDITAIDDSVSKQLSGKGKLGVISCDMIWDPANTQQAALEAANKNNTTITGQVLFSDGGAATLDFTATVATWKHMTQQDAPNKVQFTLRLTTDWTLTP